MLLSDEQHRGAFALGQGLRLVVAFLGQDQGVYRGSPLRWAQLQHGGPGGRRCGLLGQGMEPLANFGIGGEGAAIGVQTWGVVEDGRVGEARCHFRPVGQVGQGACPWSQRGTDHGRRRRPIGGAWHRRGQHHTRAGHGRRGLFLAAGRRNLAHRRRGTAGIAIGPGGERGAGTACQQCAGQGCSHERAGPGACAAGGRRAGNLREAHAWTTVPWRRHMGPG